MKTKILVLGLALIAFVLISGCLEEPVTIGFPIDSEEEAITYAETDTDVQEFIEYVSTSGWQVIPNASFYEEQNVWEVIFNAKAYPGRPEVNDVFFVIQIRPDGTIVSKGPGAI